MAYTPATDDDPEEIPVTNAAANRPALQPERIRALQRHLTALPGKLDRACRMATAKAGSSEARRPRPGSKPPVSLTVVHLADRRHKPDWGDVVPTVTEVVHRFGVVPALESWTRLVREEMWEADVEPPDMAEVPTAASEAGWLLEALPFILAHDWATELADDVRTIDAQLSSVLGERPEYHPRCRDCGCRLEPMDQGTWYACRACGRNYTIDADLRALGQVQPAMPGREVAQALGIPWATLRKWVERGLLVHESRDAKGRKLYDLDAVRTLASRVKAS